jgi:hypothetical protein
MCLVNVSSSYLVLHAEVYIVGVHVDVWVGLPARRRTQTILDDAPVCFHIDELVYSHEKVRMILTIIEFTTLLAIMLTLRSAQRYVGDLRRYTIARRVLQLAIGEQRNKRAVFHQFRRSNIADKGRSPRWIIHKFQTVTWQQNDGASFFILEKRARSLSLDEQSYWRESLPRRNGDSILSVATNKIKRVRRRNKQ